MRKINRVVRLFIVALFFFLPSWQQPPTDNGTFFVNDIIQGFKAGPQAPKLLKDANNFFIVSLFEEHLKDSTFYRAERSRQWLAHKAGATDVKDETDMIDKVFTRENYEAAKAQKGSHQWNKSRLHHELPQLAFADKVIKGETVRISYPVFSADRKYCVLYYAYRNATALIIYSKQNGDWQRAKFIPLGIG